MSTYYEFHSVDKDLVNQIIQSCHSNSFRRKLLRTVELDLSKLLALGRINDTVEEQARIVEAKLQETRKESVDMIKSKRNYNSYKYNNQKQTLNTKTVQNTRIGYKSTNGRVFFYCGGKYPHPKDKDKKK
jgi:hypothetical protein